MLWERGRSLRLFLVVVRCACSVIYIPVCVVLMAFVRLLFKELCRKLFEVCRGLRKLARRPILSHQERFRAWNVTGLFFPRMVSPSRERMNHSFVTRNNTSISTSSDSGSSSSNTSSSSTIVASDK